jgi:hypothetical protein
MKARFALALCVCLMLLVGSATFTATRGGLARFSPYSLEWEGQSEVTLLFGAFPIYRSTPSRGEEELTAMLRREGFVVPVQTHRPRQELIFHENGAWTDGSGPLYEIFIRDRRAVMEWSLADRKRAQIYWKEGFEYLRSPREADILIGREILKQGWRCQTISELRERIAIIKEQVSQVTE